MDILKQYERHLRISRKSEATIYQYVNDVKLFLNITGIDPVKCKTEHMEKFIEELMLRQNQNVTLVRKLAALRHFYEFLVLKNCVKENPFLNAPKLRVPRKDMRVLTGKEVSEVLATTKLYSETLEGRGTVSLFHLMYYLGMRVAECQSLNISNISNKPERQISFIGKGGKQRLLPIVNEKLILSLDDYLSFRERFKSLEALYISRRMNRVSIKTIQRWIKKLGNEAGLENCLTPHVVRRTFATQLLEAGADIFSVADLLGHESIATTRRYAKVTQTKRKEVLCLL